MTEISAKAVAALRERTGAGMMDCKQALLESNGDPEKAVEILRKKGIASAAKRSGRSANEGLIGTYLHHNGKVAVIVEVNCETDFVAKTDPFQNLVREVAMHIAFARPRWVSKEEVPPEVVTKEREIILAQIPQDGKPEAAREKIMEGKLNKFYELTCLLEQPFFRDDKTKVRAVVDEQSGKLGEKIQVRRFACLKVGEE